MRIVLTIDDEKYGHIPPGEIRAYIHLALNSYGGGYCRDNELFGGLIVEINILDENDIVVDSATGEINPGLKNALDVLEKKTEKEYNWKDYINK